MPWTLRKKGSKWEIIKKTTGKVVGKSDSEAMARKSIGARYVAEKGNKPVGGGSKKY